MASLCVMGHAVEPPCPMYRLHDNPHSNQGGCEQHNRIVSRVEALLLFGQYGGYLLESPLWEPYEFQGHPPSWLLADLDPRGHSVLPLDHYPLIAFDSILLHSHMLPPDNHQSRSLSNSGLHAHW